MQPVNYLDYTIALPPLCILKDKAYMKLHRMASKYWSKCLIITISERLWCLYNLRLWMNDICILFYSIQGFGVIYTSSFASSHNAREIPKQSHKICINKNELQPRMPEDEH